MVIFIGNPQKIFAEVKVTNWKDGHQGAMSVSVDDRYTSCFDNLSRNGLTGTYFLDGSNPPTNFTNLYNQGMDLNGELSLRVSIAFMQ